MPRPRIIIHTRNGNIHNIKYMHSSSSISITIPAPMHNNSSSNNNTPHNTLLPQLILQHHHQQHQYHHQQLSHNHKLCRCQHLHYPLLLFRLLLIQHHHQHQNKHLRSLEKDHVNGKVTHQKKTMILLQHRQLQSLHLPPKATMMAATTAVLPLHLSQNQEEKDQHPIIDGPNALLGLMNFIVISCLLFLMLGLNTLHPLPF
mmetsp:Transcript_21535/g.32059  ORF Transcript_21535/g.32059 Transcript_21535/m.32059 type:complete len:202 (+) Transcript_21535:464-1069(+)